MVQKSMSTAAFLLALGACSGGDGAGNAVLLAAPEGTGSDYGNGFLAVGESHVFFGYRGTPAGGVARSDKDGDGLECVACDEGEPRELAVNGDAVYWTDPGLGEVRRAALASGAVSTLWSGTVGSPVTIDATSIYWYDKGGQRIMCADLSGNDPHQVATTSAEVGSIALAGGVLYWTTPNQVVAKTLAGSDPPAAVATGRSHPRSVVSDGTDVYWAEGAWDQADNTVVVARDGGSTITEITSAGEASVFFIAVDSTHVYAADNYGGSIWKVAKEGGEIEVLADGQEFPFDIEVDESSVYWASETTAELYKVGK